MKQECDLIWKFKTEGGDIGFGVQRRECVQHVMSKEKVSAFHINMTEDAVGDHEVEENVENTENIETFKESQTVPEIQINDNFEKYERNYHNPKRKYQSDRKNKGNCALELLEEVDEMGSFVEDRKILPQTITKLTKVNKVYLKRLKIYSWSGSKSLRASNRRA